MLKDIFLKRLIIWTLLLAVPLAFGLYSIELGQDRSWDLLNYHLYNSYSFLNNRTNIDLAPAGLQTYFNPFLDIAYFTALSHLSPKILGFLIGFIQGLNFILVYKIAENILKNEKLHSIYSFLLALGGVLSVGFLSEVGTAFNDSLISIFVLTSLSIIISTLDHIFAEKINVSARISCAGILMGIGCGLKLTAAIYALSMCLALLLLPIYWTKKLKFSIIFGISVLLGLIVSGGYWFYEMWSQFGNPIFPQFNDLFRGELANSEPIRDVRFLPRGIFEKIFFPAIFTINPMRVGELRYEQLSWMFAYVAILTLLSNRILSLFRKNSGQKLRSNIILILGFFCFSYVLWLNIFGIYRYLISIEILLPLLLFIVINYFFKTELAHWGVIVFVVLITLVNVRGVPDWGRSDWSNTVYRIQPSALSLLPEPAAVYLVGQPLAWIVPALKINAPFIQLVPNMPVSDFYWRRARSLLDGRDGKIFVIFESDDSALIQRADVRLAQLGLELDINLCDRLIAYLGSTKYDYRACEAKKVKSTP